MVTGHGVSRRRVTGWLAGGAAAIGGCGTPMPSTPPAGATDGASSHDLRPWRTLQGGWMAPVLPAGVALPPALPGAGGAYVRFGAVTALALRGPELLVADALAQRLWRADLASEQLRDAGLRTITPGTLVQLGPDLAAWVIDPAARELQRLPRDGAARPPLRLPHALETPVALALADGGATALVGDGLGAHWLEWRGPGGFTRIVEPQRADGRRVTGVDGLALGADGHVCVLDRLAATVLRCTRDGLVLDSVGPDVLRQPRALVAGNGGAVWVIDGPDDSLVRLQRGRPSRRWAAAALGVARIGSVAVDGGRLAVGDLQRGAVVVWSLPAPEASR